MDLARLLDTANHVMAHQVVTKWANSDAPVFVISDDTDLFGFDGIILHTAFFYCAFYTYNAVTSSL